MARELGEHAVRITEERYGAQHVEVRADGICGGDFRPTGSVRATEVS